MAGQGRLQPIDVWTIVMCGVEYVASSKVTKRNKKLPKERTGGIDKGTFQKWGSRRYDDPVTTV